MNTDSLSRLRATMQQHQIDYYWVPASDPHLSEYVPDCWQRRRWLSGFSGSAGDLLIGIDQADLWTDGRYFIQAEQELDPKHFRLMKHQIGQSSQQHWLRQHTQQTRIGVDPSLISIAQAQQWQHTLAHTHSTLVPINTNWIDALWDDQPQRPMTPIFLHPEQHHGESCHSKHQRLRQALHDVSVDAIALSALDAIAWLFNIRGHDIPYNPVSIAFALISAEHSQLFIDLNKCHPDLMTYFDDCDVHCLPYDQFDTSLAQYPGRLLLDPSQSSWHMQRLRANAKNDNHIAQSPITEMKAIKNNVELSGMQSAHHIDAIALIRFFHWLSEAWPSGLTEYDAARQLEWFRRDDRRCKGLSFPAISAFGANGAIIHYTPDPQHSATIDDTSLYLLDSGGQYFEGTTDTTRTIHLGQPTPEQRADYSCVLKGHLQLSHAKFDRSTTGQALDAIARSPIIARGEDYAHGTGHGVGCYLCVHEGPQSISPRSDYCNLQAGMVVSNEPGLYRTGQYGIRIENVCRVTAVNDKQLTLEDLTLVPYDRSLINIEMLTTDERHWIDAYHQHVFKTLSASLSADTQRWLKQATDPL